ncbi:DUF3105 domain-containing protein [Propionibacteriaceae bacterium Y1923]|uniref:DUF3105 domain-containing protein n=1 Tax=Aestuariimicrobium sp. Y1814 TaxID=3418742 RepID=UPI003C282EA7
MSNKRRTSASKKTSTPASSRAAKLAQMQREAKKADRRSSSILWVVAAVLALALIGGVVWAGVSRSGTLDAALGEVQVYEGLSANHVETEVVYEQTPPVGGDHHGVWQNCGVYSDPLKNMHAVHSLEHGAVWITYSPSLPADQVDRLKAYAENVPFMLMSPYTEDMGSPIALSAWGHQLKLDSVDDTKITAFIREYKQGPQTPEPGAACSGGTSEVA